MEVYDIDKLISLLNQQKEWGLYYTSPEDIERILNEAIHTPPEIRDDGKTIEHLEFHVSSGYKIPIYAPRLFSMLLQISESKCLRWRKNGVIASVYPSVLLSQLKELDQKYRLKRILNKAYARGKSIFSEKTMYNDVNARTCRELIGLSTKEYKEMKKQGYINGKTLKVVLQGLNMILRKSYK